jgi:hypothetical protein
LAVAAARSLLLIRENPTLTPSRAVAADESTLPESVHEQIDSQAGGADHA